MFYYLSGATCDSTYYYIPGKKFESDDKDIADIHFNTFQVYDESLDSPFTVIETRDGLQLTGFGIRSSVSKEFVARAYEMREKRTSRALFGPDEPCNHVEQRFKMTLDIKPSGFTDKELSDFKDADITFIPYGHGTIEKHNEDGSVTGPFKCYLDKYGNLDSAKTKSQFLKKLPRTELVKSSLNGKKWQLTKPATTGRVLRSGRVIPPTDGVIKSTDAELNRVADDYLLSIQKLFSDSEEASNDHVNKELASVKEGTDELHTQIDEAMKELDSLKDMAREQQAARALIRMRKSVTFSDSDEEREIPGKDDPRSKVYTCPTRVLTESERNAELIEIIRLNENRIMNLTKYNISLGGEYIDEGNYTYIPKRK